MKEKRQHHIGSNGSSQRHIGKDKGLDGKFHPFKKRHHHVKGLL